MSDTDRARLEQVLASIPDAMALDELQGFCAAMSMADESPPPDWHGAALGEDAAPTDEALDLLERFRVATARALQDGTLAIDARTTRSGRVDYEPWCRAFLDGVELAGWFDVADAEDLHELLFPVDVLAGALSERDRAAYKPAHWRELVHDAAANLPDTIGRLHDYWRIVRVPPVTIRRDVPKVGRNDPCPCGSGRKFKQCHGKG
jgi:uncharacterized protein